MNKPKDYLQHSGILLEEIKGQIKEAHHVKTFENILALFLKVNLRCILGNLEERSKSTASRWFNQAEFDEVAIWSCIQRWQLSQIKSFERHKVGRKGHMLVRIDLTSIEKTGKELPFVRVFNKVHGIHLVVLHVSIGRLSFPLAYRIYDPNQTHTPIELALELLGEFPAKRFAGWTTWLMVDSGFYSAEFIEQTARLGYTNLSLGARDNLILRDGRRPGECRQGERVELDSYPGKALFVAYIDLPRNNTIERFFVLCTQKGCARTLRRRHARRWPIEAFFKTSKYDFGLNETRLRTETGIKRWFILSFLAYSLASVVRAYQGTKLILEAGIPTPRFILSFAQAAQHALQLLLCAYCSRVMLATIHHNAHQLGLRVLLVPDTPSQPSISCNS